MTVEVSYSNITVSHTEVRIRTSCTDRVELSASQTRMWAYDGNQVGRTQNRSQIASFVMPDGTNMIQR